MEIGLLLFPVAVLVKLGLPHYPLTITLFFGLVAASGLVAARRRAQTEPREVKIKER